MDPLRKASPARQLVLVGEMYRTVRNLALSGLKSRFPDDSPEMLRRRLAERQI